MIHLGGTVPGSNVGMASSKPRVFEYRTWLLLWLSHHLLRAWLAASNCRAARAAPSSIDAKLLPAQYGPAAAVLGCLHFPSALLCLLLHSEFRLVLDGLVLKGETGCIMCAHWVTSGYPD
jgi:hypothetical protein